MKVICLVFAVTLLASVQEALTNESILKMTEAGLTETLIVSMVQGQPGKYSMTPDELVKLKQEGVSEKVLAAMIARGSGNSALPASAPAMDTDAPIGVDVGVFYRKGGKWEEMLPEVVNWKTGGVVKSIASVGI